MVIIMNDIESKIRELVQYIRANSDEEAISFELLMNCKEHRYSFALRTPESLNSDGISMKNLRGQWIA